MSLPSPQAGSATPPGPLSLPLQRFWFVENWSGGKERGRLGYLSVTRSGMTTNTFAYNGLDARVSKTDSGGTSTFRRDGAYVTDPVLSDGGATYTAGVSERRSGTSRWLHSGIKNADSRTLAAQSVEATRDYDAFGNLIGSSGTWQGPFGNAGGFGYQEDPDASLQLLGHRYYDSLIGQFISSDFARSGRNARTYCSNNPKTGYDANGLVRVDLARGRQYWPIPPRRELLLQDRCLGPLGAV